jgi:ParB family chromosome partitioning protein
LLRPGTGARALAHADRIAEAVGLDMVKAGWTPTVDNYFGRVTKARILGAVREAKGHGQAQLIGHLKKGEMAEKAQELLAGSGWLPEPLRTQGSKLAAATGTAEIETVEPGMPVDGEQSVVSGGESAIDISGGQTETGEAPDPAHAVAAE